MSLDISIFRAINGLSGQSAFTDGFFVFLASYLPFLTGAAAIILFFVWKKSLTHKLQLLFVSFVAITVSYLIIYFVFHRFWPRLRPFESLGGVHKIIDTFGLSFPSEHATIFFLLATLVFWIRPKIGAWFFVAALLIALGRVLVGVHYPSDVLVGAIFGTIAGLLSVFLSKKFNLVKI